nr:hypothetical protein [Chitinophaga parva]
MIPVAFILARRRSIFSRAVVAPVSFTSGVGNNPEPFSFVRGTDASSWNKKGQQLVTLCLQVSIHLPEYQAFLPIKNPGNVLGHDPTGPDLLNNSKHCRPEVAVICCASALPGCTKRLAGEPACDDVDAAPERFAGHLPDVLITLCFRPVKIQYVPAKGIYFAVKYIFSSSPFGSQVKPTNPRKKAAMP